MKHKKHRARMPMGPSKKERLRYQAEDIVREKLIHSPNGKKLVAQVMKELQQIEDSIEITHS